MPFRVVDDACSWKELMYSLKQERTKLSQANPLAKKPPTPLPLVLSFVGPDKKFKGVAAVQRSQLVRAVNCTSLFPAVAAETQGPSDCCNCDFACICLVNLLI